MKVTVGNPRMSLLLIDNVANKVVRYVDRFPMESFDITDRAAFDRTFNESEAEQLRLAEYREQA